MRRYLEKMCENPYETRPPEERGFDSRRYETFGIRRIGLQTGNLLCQRVFDIKDITAFTDPKSTVRLRGRAKHRYLLVNSYRMPGWKLVRA